MLRRKVVSNWSASKIPDGKKQLKPAYAGLSWFKLVSQSGQAGVQLVFLAGPAKPSPLNRVTRPAKTSRPA